MGKEKQEGKVERNKRTGRTGTTGAGMRNDGESAGMVDGNSRTG